MSDNGIGQNTARFGSFRSCAATHAGAANRLNEDAYVNRPDLGLSVKVPDEIDIQRAREVLDELRRRLGDPSRPGIELDYLERLIKPF